MKRVHERIARSVDDLARHAFFARLRPDPDLGRMMSFAPIATFWVMSFQDIIRMNAERARDANVRRLIAGHLAEDTGHDEWFLRDLTDLFGPASLHAQGVFAAEHRATRQMSFALAAEVFFIDDDVLRLVYLEVLEAAAGLYFKRISAALVAAGHGGKLRYFGGQHLSAEASHEMHGALADELAALVLTPDEGARADAMIGRMFARFHELGDALVANMPA